MIKQSILALVVGLAVVLSASTLWSAQGAVQSPAEKIDINTASAETLMTLKGIGPKYAEKIVTYRNAHGPFEKPEDILQVGGIGPAILEKNREMITVGSSMKAP
jgi:competence protein ComEA